MTSDAAVTQFLEHCRVAKHLSANTLRAYASDLADFVGVVGSRTRVDDVDREAVRRYVCALIDEKHLKATTVKRRIATLKVLFRWLEREGVLPISIFHRLDLSVRLPTRLPGRWKRMRCGAYSAPPRHQPCLSGPRAAPTRICFRTSSWRHCSRSTGDSYDNALAESVIGLYKTEVIRPRGPWKDIEEVEFATLKWVAWYNARRLRRLLEPLGYIPPDEFEQAYYHRQAASAELAVLT
jgi:putative transposase